VYCKLQYNFIKEIKFMATTRPRKQNPKNGKPTSLMVRLDEESKAFLTRAAKLRRISVSDYVRDVTVAQARREVRAARGQILSLTADEQLAFWTALSETPQLTDSQRRLGSLMRGES
jgi:uncharacterized protein (DUF1778 family)